MRSPTQNLLIEIRSFLKETGMAPTAFGNHSLGDPNLVRDLMEGRELRHLNFLRVKTFMEMHQRERA